VNITQLNPILISSTEMGTVLRQVFPLVLINHMQIATTNALDSGRYHELYNDGV
jgi:hypothetical protein